LKERIKSLRQPEKLIASRIEEELKNPDEKYKLFVHP
jgi:predicted nucleic acid-binding OB-fold protein